MSPDQLAAWLDSYRTGAKSALRYAANDGYRRVHANAHEGELAAHELSHTGRRHLARYLADLGVRLDGMALPLPGAGLADPARAEDNLSRFRETLELCRAINTPRATVRISGFDAPGSLAREMLQTVADLADRAGIDVSVYSGQDKSETVLAAVEALRCPKLHAALDLAALGQSAAIVIERAPALGELFLRDARTTDNGPEEVRFGDGDVDFAGALAATQALERPVGLIVRRGPGSDVDAMRQGYEYMVSLLRAPSARG